MAKRRRLTKPKGATRKQQKLTKPKGFRKSQIQAQFQPRTQPPAPTPIQDRSKVGVEQGERVDYYDFGEPELRNPPATKQGHDYTDIYLDKVGIYGRPQEEGQPLETFGREDFNAFLTGEQGIIVDSSFVETARYDMYKKALQLTYKDGHTAVYAPVSVEVASSLLRAPSKGKWVHANLKAGVNPDRTWIHKYPYHPGETLETYSAF